MNTYRHNIPGISGSIIYIIVLIAAGNLSVSPYVGECVSRVKVPFTTTEDMSQKSKTALLALTIIPS